ncbi:MULTISPECIES: ubiquinone-dependent pyruvate dehydrogenase [unclassified Rathayibacter]|uniref:ubiquinone-dependent pyruvate dehydrogenase n=1 Tax=unclassified Rathayibacter TaxID=2609250 RepID=UPI0006F46A19|nr:MULTISPECIES: ubiquinone-dependent pyruvate dehydrogenase [unclassified Rathayibacter]KQQ03575.1 pyruvate dehydrogenase [Rathayibacter sp. Leaf294]KQS12031.1 pyruvate dehydrogenase [Rathayibacter sp. Leaf185]
MPTVAEVIVATLRENDVRRIYGLPGDTLNGFTDALRKDGTVSWVHVRHEEAAAFAAAASAELTGDLAVCAGGCGPGNLHLINGLYDANRSRVPVLAIAAHIPTKEIGTGYFQETHPQELFRECSVYVEYVADAKQMPRLLEIAMRAAVEKRGVAVLVIPGDVLVAEAWHHRTVRVEQARPRIIPSEGELQRTADMLNHASRVTILAGAGVQGAHDEVIALAERLQAPIVHALRGKEHIEWDNPYDVGMTGLLGFTSGYRAMEDADVVLMLGTDFPYEQFYPAGAKHIQVDIRGEQLGKRHPVDIGLVGTVRDTALALLPLLNGSRHSHHLDEARKHYARTREKLDDLAVPAGHQKPLHPQYIARVLDRLADEDAVFIPDVGSPVIWAARYVRTNGKRRVIGSFVHGSMANAVSHAIGAQTAFPDRQIIAMAGDGGLAMLLGELITIVQNNLPVKIVVFDNSSLNFVELEMKASGFVSFGTDLKNPDFAAVAEAIGIAGFRVDDSDELEEAMTRALAHDGPALISVRSDRQELSMPPNVTLEQAKGFTLYAIRTVLSGRGDELLDLASTNFRQFL